MTTDTSPSRPRIVSLLPAATEIVVALGALEQLVGITHECDHPREITHLPRVTSSTVRRDASAAVIDAEVRAQAAAGAPVFALDAALLASLAPHVLLTQSLCNVCALPEGAVEHALRALHPPPRTVSLSATTLGDVWEDVRRIGVAIGRAREADALLGALDARIRRVHETLKAAQAPRPRVAVIEWLDPLFVAGHWSPELVRRAGGIDVLATAGSHSVRVSVEAVRDAAPDVLLFAPCGFEVERARHDARALLATADWEWASGTECWALDGNALTSRPGPRLTDAIEVMAAIFAPSRFAPPASDYARPLQRSDSLAAITR